MSNDDVKTAMSRRRGGGRARRARDQRITDLGGPAVAANHAIALTRRAWPNLLDHYIPPGEGSSFAHFNNLPPGRSLVPSAPEIGGMPFIDALAIWTADDVSHVDEAASDELLPNPTGELLDLPADPDLAEDPGGHQGHPLMLDMARALAACIPAVAMAVIENTVPEALQSGDLREARQALADVHRRYRHADPDYDDDSRARVERMLCTDWTTVADAPAELGDTWQYVVRVTVSSMGELRAADGMPIRAYASLDDAKRNAIEHTDWSRAILPHERTDAFMDTLRQIAESGPEGIRILARDGSTGGMETIIEPRDHAPVAAPPTAPDQA